MVCFISHQFFLLHDKRELRQIVMNETEALLSVKYEEGEGIWQAREFIFSNEEVTITAASTTFHENRK